MSEADDQKVISAVLDRGAILYSHYGPSTDHYDQLVTIFAQDALKLVGIIDRLRAEVRLVEKLRAEVKLIEKLHADFEEAHREEVETLEAELDRLNLGWERMDVDEVPHDTDPNYTQHFQEMARKGLLFKKRKP